MAAANGEVILRPHICLTCGKLFWICRHCYRGQRYCSCRSREKARRLQRHEANRRYEQSLGVEGREDHCARQRDYRQSRGVYQLLNYSFSEPPGLRANRKERVSRAVEGGQVALQALQIAKSTGHPFPLFLLDGQMPEMDGFILAELIKKDPELVGATIMMLTSAGHLGDAPRCRELGFLPTL